MMKDLLVHILLLLFAYLAYLSIVYFSKNILFYFLSKLFPNKFNQNFFGFEIINSPHYNEMDEEIEETEDEGRIFLHSKIKFKRDNIYFEQTPIRIFKNNTSYSTSFDPTFCYSGSIIKREKDKIIASLKLTDYFFGDREPLDLEYVSDKTISSDETIYFKDIYQNEKELIIEKTFDKDFILVNNEAYTYNSSKVFFYRPEIFKSCFFR